MGIYTDSLECGCIQQTLTFENPIKTITIYYCKDHMPTTKPPSKPTTKTNTQSR
jgi:hypothetical protein